MIKTKMNICPELEQKCKAINGVEATALLGSWSETIWDGPEFSFYGVTGQVDINNINN